MGIKIALVITFFLPIVILAKTSFDSQNQRIIFEGESAKVLKEEMLKKPVMVLENAYSLEYQRLAINYRFEDIFIKTGHLICLRDSLQCVLESHNIKSINANNVRVYDVEELEDYKLANIQCQKSFGRSICEVTLEN